MEDQDQTEPYDDTKIEMGENHDETMEQQAMEALQQYAAFANYTDAYEAGKEALKNHFTIMGKHELNESRAALDELYRHNN